MTIYRTIFDNQGRFLDQQNGATFDDVQKIIKIAKRAKHNGRRVEVTTAGNTIAILIHGGSVNNSINYIIKNI